MPFFSNRVTFSHSTFGYPQQDGYSFGFPDTFDQVDVEDGWPLFYPKGPKQTRPVSIVFHFDETQMAAFNTFYFTSLENGTKYVRMRLDFGNGLEWAIVHFIAGQMTVENTADEYTLSAQVLAFREADE